MLAGRTPGLANLEPHRVLRRLGESQGGSNVLRRFAEPEIAVMLAREPRCASCERLDDLVRIRRVRDDVAPLPAPRGES